MIPDSEMTLSAEIPIVSKAETMKLNDTKIQDVVYILIKKNT